MSRHLVATLTALLVCADSVLFAQAPDSLSLLPSHVTIGSSATAELIGKNADQVERLHFVRPGIEAQVIEKGKGKAQVKVSVAADVPLGDVDVWLVSSTSLSAPIRLTVGNSPTSIESEPNNTAAKAQEVTLPVTVCGRIEPGTDSDWYRVQLNAGDGLTLACRSTSLGGTVQPTLTVLDPAGLEIAHDTLTQAEPVVHIQAEASGAYAVGVQDRSYRSMPSPFYQLTLTTGPWIVGAYPPTLQRGQSHQVALYGYQLPSSEPLKSDIPLRVRTTELVAPEANQPIDRGWLLSRSLFIDSFEFRQPDAGGIARMELIDRSIQDAHRAPPDREPSEMNRYELPFDAVNRFESPRDVVHWYRFTAQSGRTYWLEAVAERIDRACDLELIVHDASGKALTTIGNLTTPKELAGEIVLDSRDPAGAWKAPADGDYLLAVRDLLAVPGSDQRAYRLSVGPRKEDVRIVAQLAKNSAGNGWAVKPGGRLTISLAAIRLGGHEGPIEIRAERLPAGVQIPSVTIAAKKATGTLTFMADKDAEPWIGPIQLVATTTANNAPFTTSVRATSSVNSATPAMSRLLDEIVLAVLSNAKK